MYDMAVSIPLKILNSPFELLGSTWSLVSWLPCFHLCGEYPDMLCFVFALVVGNLPM